MTEEVVTRTTDTENKYRQRAVLFIRRYLREACQIHTPFPTSQLQRVPAASVFMFAAQMRANWQAATWRQNKSALMFFYQEVLHSRQTAAGWETAEHRLPFAVEPIEQLKEALNMFAVLRNLTVKPEPLPNRTSRLRKKQISTENLNEVIVLLRSMQRYSDNLKLKRAAAGKQDGSRRPYQYAGLTAQWLVCGALTGLRPKEWLYAYYTDTQVGEDGAEIQGHFLKVKNCKHTNGRGNGEYRTLNLSAYSEVELRQILEFLLLFKDWTEVEYEKFYQQCKDQLKRANNILLEGRLNEFVIFGEKTKRKGGKVLSRNGSEYKRIQLYTGRHKFTSEAKKLFSLTETAALLGHASDKTAGIHYGKRSSASGGLKIVPVAQEVKTVRVKNNQCKLQKTPDFVPARRKNKQNIL